MAHSSVVRASEGGATTAYLPDSGADDYSVLRYELELDYRVTTNRLSGTAAISALAIRRLDVVSLDLVGLKVAKASVDRVRARVTQSPTKLQLYLERPIEPGEAFEVSVEYAGAPGPRRSPWGEVGWEELSDGVLVAAQPHGAPTWFPCNDRPADKASYRIAVTTPSTYRVVANGALVERTARSSRTRWVYEMAEPMATYLATVQIGMYGVRELSADGATRQVAHYPTRLGSQVAAAFARQPRMMQLFERLFGPYPFEEYGVVVTDDDLEIPLEAQGVSVFGRNHLAAASERLIAHELAHSWFGNSLTASSWQYIWLHEGFACYAEWLWSEESGGETADRLAEQHAARLASLGRELIVGDPGPQSMFDDRVYKRGALTLHAIRRMLGDAAFFAMLTAWVAENRHGSVTTAGFVEHVARHAADPAPVVAAIEEWLFSGRLPKLPGVTGRRQR